MEAQYNLLLSVLSVSFRLLLLSFYCLPHSNKTSFLSLDDDALLERIAAELRITFILYYYYSIPLLHANALQILINARDEVNLESSCCNNDFIPIICIK